MFSPWGTGQQPNMMAMRGMQRSLVGSQTGGSGAGLPGFDGLQVRPGTMMPPQSMFAPSYLDLMQQQRRTQQQRTQQQPAMWPMW